MKYDENKEKYFSENLAKYLKEENDKLENKKKKINRKKINGNFEIWEKNIDYEARKQRKNDILNGTAEKNIIETLEKFDPEQVQTRLGFTGSIANKKEALERVIKMKEKYESGEINQNINGIFSLEEENQLKKESKNSKEYELNKNKKIRSSKIFKAFDDNFEILDTKIDSENAMGAYVCGNKKTKEIEIFYFASSGLNQYDKSLTKEEKEIATKEKQVNIQAKFKVTDNQKAALNFADEIEKKAKKGITSEKSGITYKNLTYVNGSSKGCAEAIYTASNKKGIKAVKCKKNFIFSI